tara:strand:- start:1052 stop:2035 length:984 start_codon:yes stop_codon:yes gene_type:complete
MNIGLNITKNISKFSHFLSMIQKNTPTYKQCNFINVSDSNQLKKNISNLDVLLTYDINPEIFQYASNKLKWIHFGVAGVEKNLFPEIIKSKTILTNCSGIHAGPVSEFIIACILYHCKRFNNCNEFKRTQEWKQWDIAKTMIQLKGKTLGIIGYGQIGKATARLAKQFGMKVIATRRLQKKITSNRFVDYLLPLSNINQLYKDSDFIAVTCPLTPMTDKMISFNEFSIMKDTAYIINIARGGIINDEALIDALDHDKIFGGALDVFTDEPLEKGHPYFKYDSIFLSPHISGNFPEYQTDMINQFINNLICFLNGKVLKNRICKKRLY